MTRSVRRLKPFYGLEPTAIVASNDSHSVFDPVGVVVLFQELAHQLDVPCDLVPWVWRNFSVLHLLDGVIHGWEPVR